eukprot:CAMPEP_0175878248 /NCGR_PEP_ID=MMETSP0107_2-20121207/41069_1 /TAXON_ID=195067 ORGANISM="Goniomonas pacifica, Strain CCMP1869" /NCGR_SAMPLE_ID=MMETSP0107_2 /ASSEMBLY_ACC=CAM_ASM_000203 /LENGTH=53 /DNA_ID=CAMNT_0017197685 /DNA_START=238 /DNA_END=396 /DNA_ORIENTATION=+
MTKRANPANVVRGNTRKCCKWTLRKSKRAWNAFSRKPLSKRLSTMLWSNGLGD